MAIDDLPLECLQLIIRELSSKADLCSLLTTNKRLCAMTLPFLYTNPFQWIVSTVKKDQYHPVLRKLIVCLIKSSSREYWTPMLAAVFDLYSAGDYQTGPSGIDYLAYVQYLDLTGLTIESAYEYSSPSIQGFVKESRLAFIYQAREMDLEINPYVHKDVVPRRHFQVDVRVALFWALCRPILGQVRSLSIAVSDLQQFIDVAGQLKSLTSITFILDKKHDRPHYLVNILQEQNPDLLQSMQQVKDEAMAQMVNFVRKHTQLIPSRLMYVECPQDSSWPGMEQSCPPLYMKQIRACLPPYQPKVINKHNWSDFVENLDRLDYSLLEKIVVPQHDIPWLHFLASQGTRGLEILRHSRNTRVLDISSPGSRPFLWARKDAEKRRHQALEDVPPVELPPGSLPPPPFPPALPIETVRLRMTTPEMTEEMDDVAFAFSNSLRSFVVRYRQRDIHHDAPIPIVVGNEWDLPQLRQLRISCLVRAMQVDPYFLLRSPDLETLDLLDGINNYRCSEIITWSPARLPKLKTLTLTGSAAIAFHPETLRHCTSLEELSLELYSWSSGTTFIPSPTEISRFEPVLPTTEMATIKTKEQLESLSLAGSFARPTWRWDWHLPQLTSIRLTSEFAWRFQFRMLQGCPNLEMLILSTITIDSLQEQGQHLRILKKEDFEDAAGNTIVASSRLRAFHLVGQWSISDAVLLYMFGAVMPQLKELSEQGCCGFTFEGWMNATDELKKLKRVTSKLNVNELTLQLARLYPVLPGVTGHGDVRVIEEEVEEGDDPRIQVVHVDGEDTRVVYNFNDGSRYVKGA